MITLSLLRHAKSSWADEGMRDFDRPLNARGIKDLEYMPQRFLEKVGVPDHIFCSEARRAQATGRGFAEALNAPISIHHNLYHASSGDLLSFFKDQELKDGKHYLLVAHNPGLTLLINRLAEDLFIDNLPTCGFVSFALDLDKMNTWGERNAQVMAYDYPKLNQ